MYALLQCLEDMEEKIFCFCSVADAKRFKKFVNIYMHEHGGNGYGGYWVYRDAEITEVKTVPKFSCTELNHNFVNGILRDILIRRTAKHEPEIKVNLTINNISGAIKFKVGKIPPKQRPTIGDMYNVIGKTPKSWEHRMNTGRVFEDLCDTLKVYSNWDEQDDKPEPKSGTIFALIDAKSVMKIEDFCRKIKGYK